MLNKQTNIDATDLLLLNILWNNGRSTLSEMGSSCGLSAPGVSERLRKLERSGVILGYAPRINLAAAGFPITAFVEITLEHPSFRKNFLELVESLPEIRECHHIAGNYDYLLKTVCSTPAHLEEIISSRLKECPGVSRTKTTIVLSTWKERPSSPIPGQP